MNKIVFGILFIIAGITGQFVLVGTNSPVALIIVGVIYLGWGVAMLDVKRDIRRQNSGRGSASDFKKPSNYDY